MMIFLIILLSCKGGGGSSGTLAELNPDLEVGTWVMSYSNGVNIFEDRITVNGNQMTIEVYGPLNLGSGLASSETWDLTATDSDSAIVDDRAGTFTIDYRITGNQLDVWFSTGEHNTYQR